MARLILPDDNTKIENFEDIVRYLDARGIFIKQWQANAKLSDDADQETILNAYAHELTPYMADNGYQSADVINVHSKTENLQALQEKFLAEHTHSEDEVRFFVDGQGYFWFNTEGAVNKDAVFAVHCTAGDLLSVPAGVKHWFDMGEPAFVKVIRIFTDTSGWTPLYTNSGIDQIYQRQLAY
ncbi:MAG: hypothetical protein VKJ04_05705 [Vampirovibrionales bacterium]|nr:hypothetical protein [Vampirovibrionales bacterium]